MTAKKKSTPTFFDHLDELRICILKALGLFAVVCLVFFNFAGHFIPVFVKPVGYLVFNSPSEAFMAHMAVTIAGSFIITFPFTLYQLWAFVATGLTEQERKHIRLYGPISFLLFVAGLCFAFFVAIPIALKFLMGFSSEYLRPMITVESYISFVTSFALAFGVIFETPLVLAFLASVGIATPAFLIQKRRHAIIIILIISAILTPPDVISQIVMAVPLFVLYEIGIILTRLTYKKKFD